MTFLLSCPFYSITRTGRTVACVSFSKLEIVISQSWIKLSRPNLVCW